MTNPTARPNQASGLGEKVRQGAQRQLDKQKSEASRVLGSIASAARQTTQHLREEGQDKVAGVVEQAAERVDSFSRSVEHMEMDDVLIRVRAFARRQPTLFVATAFGVGILIARVMKSGSPSNGGTRRPRGSDASVAGEPAATVGEYPAL